MKSIKGLIFIISIALIALAAVKVDSTNKTLEDNIFTAIRNIDYTSINILLSDGIDVNAVDSQGNTPLMVAAQVGNPRIVDIILSHNPDVNKKNNTGVTALMIASETGQLNIVKKLVFEGADIALADKDGNTAITLASKFGQAEIVRFFREMRA